MIVFTGTRSLRDSFFLKFSNDKGSSVEVPVDESMMIWFMRYMDRLEPPTNAVEDQKPDTSNKSFG